VIKFGEIIAVNLQDATARARIFSEGIETNWLPVLQISTKRFKWFAIPEAGEVVALLVNEDYEGVILGAIYDSQNLPIENTSASLLIGGNADGGLLKAERFLLEFEKLKELVEAMKSGLDVWTPVPMDGGAALKTAMSSQLAGKTTGDYSNLINDKIKHG
jgi:hypothetical protein